MKQLVNKNKEIILPVVLLGMIGTFTVIGLVIQNRCQADLEYDPQGRSRISVNCTVSNHSPLKESK